MNTPSSKVLPQMLVDFTLSLIHVRLYAVSISVVRYFTEKQQFVQFQCLTFNKNESPTILNLNKSNFLLYSNLNKNMQLAAAV